MAMALNLAAYTGFANLLPFFFARHPAITIPKGPIVQPNHDKKTMKYTILFMICFMHELKDINYNLEKVSSFQ